MEKVSKPHAARMVFAKNLRQVRRLKEVSQEALALQAGLSRTYVSEVERGERNVSIDNMGLLADALGVKLKDLLDPEMLKTL
ncbi:putative transcriptional regulator [Pseudogulbenkiania sp. NH8B]|jgi:transcriptional regulator with XRE-family HTH domain|uniref:helix-turn-helix domain-containing protein n=1 Tax=Chromobacteriaceae TaxID=1499392 RepID=UPI0002279F6D|nr:MULTISPECIES: helix-turn-helix transcriptional regulator [Chromobacteriaceae]BAK76724.1 putative transcriptional regulator [Pseudogulbenkiania sp. NH8B]